MVDAPGGLGANKGYWMVQLRDRYGKFVEMGGGVIFEVSLPGVVGPVRAKGVFRGMLTLDKAKIEVLDNSEIPKGIYEVDRKFIEGAQKSKAKLSEDYVDKKLGGDLPNVPGIEEVAPLKPSISGDEALKIRMKSVAKHLKEKGRFPIPRIGALGDAGKDTDIANGAKLDYQKVFDSSPEVKDRFKTFENMWDYVAKNGTNLTTQSPNDLNDIPEDMKLLNRAYAEHVLEMDPDGLLTVYRNAVNGKDTESESAVGYVSLDRQMAWDYNSTRENIGSNGRYEIDVKPDEVYGLLGYSQIEDEYGLTIGRGVTQQEGRVRRVGDLEPAKLAPWLEEWNSQFKRGQGSSPLRGFNIAGEYDFHEVEDFGENIQEFFSKYNLQASDVAAMFDKLHGEGAYARYKESGNTVSYQLIKKMFIKLENGNLGLNAEYLDSFNVLKPNAEYKDDQFDNIMKMLSTFQELTGQHFMTHKTRQYTPPAANIPESENKETLDAPQGNTAGIVAELERTYDIKDFKKTGQQKGSNPGGTYTGPDGTQYYAKTPRSEKHLKNELLASSFYELAGIPAARMRYGDDGTEDGKIFSEIISGEILRDVSLSPETKKQIQDGFAIDAWLANWDVAGLGDDNIVINDKGEAFRIDVGGALLFRAQGGDKGDKFSDEVTELDTLRDSNRNPRSGALFGDMTDEDLKASAQRLLEITPRDIDTMVDAAFDEPVASELKRKLKARRMNILKRFGLNQTGIFKEYSPNNSSVGEDTSLVDLGFDPEEEITIYRGIPQDADGINPGDWVTTLPQLAKDYAGTGKVVSMKVKLKDLYGDASHDIEEGIPEEMVYRPK